MNREVLLVGNPNSGKTTLFNKLTKSNEHTGNWHGVTVDKKNKNIIDSEYVLTDLPGTYSLNDYTFEEKITSKECVFTNKKIINIIDYNCLQRGLNLTLQLIEMGKDFIVVLNPIRSNKNSIDINKLKTFINKDILIFSKNNTNSFRSNIIFCLNKLNNTQNIVVFDYYKKFNYIAEIINEKANKNNLTPIFCAIKIAEKNEDIISILKLNDEELKKIEKYIKENNLTISEVNNMRFKLIDHILKECCYVSSGVVGYSKLDKILLNKYLSFIIFFIICALAFYIIFCSIGGYLSDSLSCFFTSFISKNIAPVIENNFNQIFYAFIIDGIFNSIVTILSFLPQVVLLFIFLAVLEESGYISRVAFIFEDFFNLIGLSGKSIFTFFMSLGCATSAILSARTLSDKNSQIKTIMLSPFFICTAKISIITIICSAFFKNNFYFILIFYIVSILLVVVVALLLNAGKLKAKQSGYLLDFPNYNIISLKKVVNTTITNTFNFLSKVGSVLLLCFAIIWLLNNFDFGLRYVGNNKNLKSIINFLGDLILPVFKPIGLNNSGIISALISGLIAKEMIIATLAQINGVEGSEFVKSLINPMFPVSFTTASAMSFILFSLFYLPCISSIIVMKNEMGLKNTIIASCIQLSVTYVICFIVYHSILNIKILLILALSFLLFIIFTIAYRYYKKHNYCFKCKNCKINCCKK